jgi:hypothetical protein
MSFLHRYTVDGKNLYLVSDKVAKPSGTLTVKQEDWRGRATGKYNTVVSQLGALSWTKEEKEPAGEHGPEAPKGKRAVSEAIRSILK